LDDVGVKSGSGYIDHGGLSWGIWGFKNVKSYYPRLSIRAVIPAQAGIHKHTMQNNKSDMTQAIQVGVLMGSNSDWDTMQHAVAVLQEFGIAHEARVVSAHRMPDDMFAYAEAAAGRGLQAIIAGAGGAAHLPGMLAAKTTVPVLGVPVASKHLQGVDSLHSIVQMPKGIPVATFAIGTAGAANAALFAVAMLANHDAALRAKLDAFRAKQTEVARNMTLPLVSA
jgi:5-(carboxyamino)imidazole ribonucleotide mutase